MPQYKDFVTEVGYGDPAGYGGINCRHSMGAYLPGVSPPPPTEAELAEMERKELETTHYKWKDARGVEHERDFTLRDALDRQRNMESQMRITRSEARAQKEAGQDAEYAALKRRYSAQRKEYRLFSEAMNIEPDWGRITVDGLGRI